MSKRKNTRFVSQREREELLENFLENLDNDDNDDVFENTNVDSGSDTDTDMEEIDPTVEGDLNEAIDLNNDNDINNVNNEDAATNNVNNNTNNNQVERENIDFRNNVEEIELPRKAKFLNLDEVTNEENYDPIYQNENKQYNFSTANKQFQMKWFTKNRNPRNVGRQPASNIVEGDIGPLGPAKNVATPLEAWQLFVTDESLEKIVTHTNTRISEFRERFQETLQSSTKYTYCKTTDLIEIKAFIGLLYLRGAINFNTTDVNIVFSHEATHKVFSATMAKNRFKFLEQFIQFDDKHTRPERWRGDKYAAIREFFESVNVQNAKMRGPSTFVSVDETLYPYRGKIGLKQYNPSKPAKYGLLYRSLCDAVVPYTYYTLPYNGKPDSPDNEFYVTGTDEYTKYLVTNFLRYNKLSGRNISLDRYFTSVTLAQWCLEKKISIVGTMRTDRKGIPKEMKNVNDREEKSTKYCHSEDNKLLLVSYVDKKKSGKKNVIVLSTMHKSVAVTRDRRKKPNMIVLYDHTKGGVDIVDLISSKLSVRIKSRRWTINALAFILDTVRTNAKTILREAANSSLSTFNFTWELGKQLVKPHIERRYNNPVGIQKHLYRKMGEVLGKEEIPQYERPVQQDQGKRCAMCLEEIIGHENYKTKKNKLNNKIKTACCKCRYAVCAKHTVVTCQKCHEENI